MPPRPLFLASQRLLAGAFTAFSGACGAGGKAAGAGCSAGGGAGAGAAWLAALNRRPWRRSAASGDAERSRTSGAATSTPTLLRSAVQLPGSCARAATAASARHLRGCAEPVEGVKSRGRGARGTHAAGPPRCLFLAREDPGPDLIEQSVAAACAISGVLGPAVTNPCKFQCKVTGNGLWRCLAYCQVPVLQNLAEHDCLHRT